MSLALCYDAEADLKAAKAQKPKPTDFAIAHA
jgi:hypothetical protein